MSRQSSLGEFAENGLGRAELRFQPEFAQASQVVKGIVHYLGDFFSTVILSADAAGDIYGIAASGDQCVVGRLQLSRHIFATAQFTGCPELFIPTFKEICPLKDKNTFDLSLETPDLFRFRPESRLAYKNIIATIEHVDGESREPCNVELDSELFIEIARKFGTFNYVTIKAERENLAFIALETHMRQEITLDVRHFGASPFGSTSEVAVSAGNLSKVAKFAKYSDLATIQIDSDAPAKFVFKIANRDPKTPLDQIGTLTIFLAFAAPLDSSMTD